MAKDLRVTCPCCESILIIDRATGKIVESREPLVEESSGDRLTDAFLKTKQDKEKTESLFANMKQDQEERKKAAEDLFKSSLREASEEPHAKPDSIYDND